MTKIAEFRGKTHDELNDTAVSLKKELFNLRFQAASGEAPNTARFRQVRRDIARVKTLLNEPAGVAVAVKKAAKAPKAAKAEKETKEPKAKKTTSKKKASGE